MRRIGVVVGTAALVAVGLGVAGVSTAGASAPTAFGSGAHPNGGPPGNPVTSGSTWTLYDLELGLHAVCTVNTFSTKTFTDDQSGSGTYKSTTKKTKMVITSPLYNTTFTYTATWVSGDGGYWLGTFAGNGLVYGPFILVAGANPLGWSDAIVGNPSC